MTIATHLDFDRGAWARLRPATPLTLAESDLTRLTGLNEPVSLAEVEDIYLPVARLVAILADGRRSSDEALAAFMAGSAATRDGRPDTRDASRTTAIGGNDEPLPRRTTPFVLGIAGSVAVGKSTFARVLRALLSRWPGQPRVDLVTTDGFLYPNAVLESSGLLGRKGFPESYDVRRLVTFLQDVVRGDRPVRAPVYSHQAYDIVPGQHQTVDRPDIVIIEGLNVLQSGAAGGRRPRVLVSSFFEFSVYIDAHEADIEAWYVDRFLRLRQTVFREPGAYFHRYASLSDEQARATARDIWRTINGVNLRQNIAPTRDRAHLVLEKGPDHAVRRARLRPAFGR